MIHGCPECAPSSPCRMHADDDKADEIARLTKAEAEARETIARLTAEQGVAIRGWEGAAADRDKAEATIARLEQERGCPCLHITPCHTDCTCVRPASSRGCRRCCRYGSREQQKVMAEHLARLEQERDALRSALSGLVGATDRAELEAMEAAVRMMAAPADDKARSIDAIHALIASLP